MVETLSPHIPQAKFPTLPDDISSDLFIGYGGVQLHALYLGSPAAAKALLTNAGMLQVRLLFLTVHSWGKGSISIDMTSTCMFTGSPAGPVAAISPILNVATIDVQAIGQPVQAQYSGMSYIEAVVQFGNQAQVRFAAELDRLQMSCCNHTSRKLHVA